MRESIKVKTESLNFKFRVSGIVIKNNKVLLVEMDDSGFFCLPGGHVELGETTEEACLRELEEEVGKKFKIKNYCGVIENFFTNKYNNNIHEIAFYYTLTPLEELNVEDYIIMENDKGNTVKLNFKWIDINELEEYNIQPNYLKDILKKDLNFSHLVINN